MAGRLYQTCSLSPVDPWVWPAESGLAAAGLSLAALSETRPETSTALMTLPRSSPVSVASVSMKASYPPPFSTTSSALETASLSCVVAS